MKYLTIFNNLRKIVLTVALSTAIIRIGFAQVYRPVSGWPQEVNHRIENFLNSTIVIQERKVAVFDCDGTLFGQVPHYLADEALYSYYQKRYAGKSDKISKEKMQIIRRMREISNVSTDYLRSRSDFLSGMSRTDIEQMGRDCFHEKYQEKFYPQMKELLSNLKEYGFEIWVLSASPELLYQGFVHSQLGIPVERILGVRSIVRNDTATNILVLPIPQDGGKADAIQTLIKAKPLFVGGNSRGDMEMMNESVGLKLIVNPDDQKVERGHEAGKMEGFTVKDYWEKNGAVIVYCQDIAKENQHFDSGNYGVPANKSNWSKN